MGHPPYNPNKPRDQLRTPQLPEEIIALLNVCSAVWEWSHFSMSWQVGFPWPGGGRHFVLVCPAQIDTLDAWTDMCLRTRTTMAECTAMVNHVS